MEKNEFRAVIKHLRMKGLTKEIKAELDNVHNISAFATVYNWVNEFKHGRTHVTSFGTSNWLLRQKSSIKSTILF